MNSEEDVEFCIRDGIVWVGGVLPSGAKSWVAANPKQCAEVADRLMAERDGLRAALRRIADNSSGLVRRAATQALEGKFV